jgi:hypothetical protein
MRARRVARWAVLASLASALVPFAIGAGTAASATEIRVPEDARTLQLAIAQARPGDTILLAAGTYPGGNVVPASKHDITIRGADRNRVVLDGDDRRKDGILVRADGVSILNLSAHNFRRNAFYFVGADRYRASYVTVWNVEGYGIYAEGSEHGMLEHDYVSGAADAAYYIGECRPCDALVANVVATLSAVGYSGTNASDVVIRDSVWDRNGAGILPNTYANEALPPQARATVVRNTVSDSGQTAVPIRTALAGFVGIGIALAGGNDNVVRENRVTGSERYGIAVFPTARYVSFNPAIPEPGPPWRPRGNRVVRNVVTGSGRADLALGRGTMRTNCFLGNTVRTTMPAGLQRPDCAGASVTGGAAVAAVLTRPVRVMVAETLRRRRPPSYRSMPTPPAQPSMPAG